MKLFMLAGEAIMVPNLHAVSHVRQTRPVLPMDECFSACVNEHFELLCISLTRIDQSFLSSMSQFLSDNFACSVL